MAEKESAVVVEIARLDLKPGDRLVLKFPRILSNEQCDRIKAELTAKDVLPEGVRVLILDGGADVAVMRAKEGPQALVVKSAAARIKPLVSGVSDY